MDQVAAAAGVGKGVRHLTRHRRPAGTRLTRSCGDSVEIDHFDRTRTTVPWMRRFALLVGLLIASILVVVSLAVGLSIKGATEGTAAWTRYAKPGGGYNRAPEAMPVLLALERERVTFLRTQDWCQAYNDGSDVRANTLRETCTLTLDRAELFGAATRARYETLAQLAAALPYDMNYVQIAYGASRQMTGAQISLATAFSRESLVYEPGYSLGALRAGAVAADPMTYTAIDPDWYHLLEDWN